MSTTQETQTIIQVAADTVAAIHLNSNQTVEIMPQLLKDNIRMGFIATTPDFPNDKSYYHYLFPANGPEGYVFSPQISGKECTNLYLYLLLPITEVFSIPDAHNASYYVGIHDGEANDTGQNTSGSFSVLQSPNYLSKSNVPPSPAETLQLPGDPLIEISGYCVSLDGAGYNLRSAQLAGYSGAEKAVMEEKTRIQVLCGLGNQKLIAYLDAEHPGPYDIPIGMMGTADALINLIALVAPTVDPNDPNNFTFEVGDPEKDGKVTIRNI